MIKNLPANAGDAGEVGLVPGSGRSLEKGVETHSSVLAWRIPGMGVPGPGEMFTAHPYLVSTLYLPKPCCILF